MKLLGIEMPLEEFDYLIVSCKEGIKRTVLYGVECNNSDI